MRANWGRFYAIDGWQSQQRSETHIYKLATRIAAHAHHYKYSNIFGGGSALLIYCFMRRLGETTRNKTKKGDDEEGCAEMI